MVMPALEALFGKTLKPAAVPRAISPLPPAKASAMTP